MKNIVPLRNMQHGTTTLRRGVIVALDDRIADALIRAGRAVPQAVGEGSGNKRSPLADHSPGGGRTGVARRRSSSREDQAPAKSTSAEPGDEPAS